MNFRYEFEKGSKKYICPKCNKRTFVRYVYQETKEYAAPQHGRCDREKKCGYFSYPQGSFNGALSRTVELPKPPSYHPYDLMVQSCTNYHHNNFIDFLKKTFSEGQIEMVLSRYFIGTSKYWKGATVFWQIDQDKKVRHGKIMLYDKFTGKRIKRESGGALISSVRTALKLTDFNLKQCLFGLHLLEKTNHNTIAIVESEKTAVIMSLYKPEYLWLATGSKNGFKYDYLKPIRNKKIMAFPDKGEFYDWQEKAIELNKMGFDISVSQILEEIKLPPGSDLADFAFNESKDFFLDDPKYNSSLQKNSMSPPIKSIAEEIISRWAIQKPEIWNLIESFKLEDHNGCPIRQYK